MTPEPRHSGDADRRSHLRRRLLVLTPLAILAGACASAPPRPQPILPPLAAVQSAGGQGRPYAMQSPPPPSHKPPVDFTAKLQEIDDHYAKRDATTRALLQQTLDAIKHAASAADLQALKTTLAQLESQAAATKAGSDKTASLVTSLTTRVQAAETALAKSAADADAAHKNGGGPTADADKQLTDALRAVQAPPYPTEPVRQWLAEHPDHPKHSEALYQLAVGYLHTHQNTSAALYLQRLVEQHPDDPLAPDAKALLTDIQRPAVHAKPAAKKSTKRAVARSTDARTPKSAAAAPKNGAVPDPAPTHADGPTLPPTAAAGMTPLQRSELFGHDLVVSQPTVRVDPPPPVPLDAQKSPTLRHRPTATRSPLGAP